MKKVTSRGKTSTSCRRAYAPSPVAILRSLMPNRALSFAEACQVAELQATRLLAHTGTTDGPVSDSAITELPRIAVRRVGNLISAGATTWSRGSWQICINAGDPWVRQRFTLAHELKHVLDASHEDAIYGHLPTGPTRERHIEAVCDHFAACLLMPRVWVKQHWYAGMQDLMTLAWHFEVSQQAMLIRLQTLGLVDPLPRCATGPRRGSKGERGSRQHRRTYQRAAFPMAWSICLWPPQFDAQVPLLEGVLR